MLAAIAVFAFSLIVKSSKKVIVDASTVPGTAAAFEKAITKSTNIATSITQDSSELLLNFFQ